MRRWHLPLDAQGVTTTMEPRKDLLDIDSLSLEEIEFVLKTAGPFKELFTKSIKKVPPLRGKTVLTLFYEPSTRTRSSFEIAAKRVSADVTNFTVSTSSVVKGESILDTIDPLQAMKCDYIVVRHGAAGVPNMIAKHTNSSVINAGDGFHSHPTQALLDAFTMRESLGNDLSGKKLLIVGDILHSRVARSVCRLSEKLGMQVGALGPGSLIPRHRPDFIRSFRNYDDALAWKPDIIYLLRVQLERQNDQFFPSLNEYHNVYGLTDERQRQVRDEGTWIMHPGPVNRGVELGDAVMNYERTLINQQVENGIAVRMAVLYWLNPQTETNHG